MYRIICVLSLAALLLGGCQGAFLNDDGEKAAPAKDRSSGVTVDNNEADQQSRIVGENEVIIPESTGVRTVVQSLTLVSSIASPVVDGVPVQASFVYKNGNYAYVGYNTQGNTWRGGVEIIDISTPASPRVVSQALFNNTDVQGLTIDGDILWIAEAVNKNDTGFATSGVIERVKLVNGKFPSPYVSTFYNVPAPAAKGVRKAGSWLYSTASSSGGGAFCHSLRSNNYMQIVEGDYYDNAQGISIDGTSIGAPHMVVEGGERANLHIYTVGSSDHNTEPIIYNIGRVAPYNGKNWSELSNNVAYVAMGEGGFKAFNVGWGAVTRNPTPLYQFPRPGNGLTNAVTVDNCYIYVANGEDGLYVFDRPSGYVASGSTLRYRAVKAFGGSVNYAKAYDNLLFVATGEGGLNILRRGY